MADLDAKANRYLPEAREALLGKLDGLSEYGMWRPLMPTVTKLLDLVNTWASPADVVKSPRETVHDLPTTVAARSQGHVLGEPD